MVKENSNRVLINKILAPIWREGGKAQNISILSPSPLGEGFRVR